MGPLIQMVKSSLKAPSGHGNSAVLRGKTANNRVIVENSDISP
jgi:hypothetical protein